MLINNRQSEQGQPEQTRERKRENRESERAREQEGREKDRRMGGICNLLCAADDDDDATTSCTIEICQEVKSLSRTKAIASDYRRITYIYKYVIY